MIPKQLSGFVSKLTKTTDAGKLKWNPERNTLRQGQAYLCESKGITVGISKFWVEEDERTYIMFWVEPPTGDPAGFSVSNYDDDYLDMRTLYELASISAADINEETLDGFFED